AGRADANRDHARCLVDDEVGDEVRREAVARPLHLHRCEGIFERANATEPGADIGAPAMLMPRRYLGAEPSILECHHRRRDAELQEPIDVLQLALVEPLAGIPAFDLARELRSEVSTVELRDRASAVLAADQTRPCSFEIVADRRDEADAGNYDATHAH